MSRANVLVLGGSGFLGSHVADALSGNGYQVKLFDSKHSPFLRSDQEMIIGDILDKKSLVKAAKNCEYVFNFAGLADIDEAKNRPFDTANLNVLGNINALEAAHEAGAKRFIFASSVYVFSELGSFYRASKQAAERFIEAYHERYGLNYTILRYGSLYGRRADERNGIYRLIKQALEEKSIVYHGSSEAMREYIHVTDAAQLTVKILDDKYINNHIVLTGQERLSIGKLLKMIAEMLPQDIKIQYSEQAVYAHYSITPYAFYPKIGHKLVSNDYVDMGQGLLDCLAEVHEKLHKNIHSGTEDWIVLDHEPVS